MCLSDNTNANLGQVVQHNSATGKIPFAVMGFDSSLCWIFGQWQSGAWSGQQGWVYVAQLTST